MGKAQRDKGIRGEHAWAKECHKNGFFGVRRLGQPMYTRGSVQPDCDGLPHLHQEVKNVERLDIRKAMAQSIGDAKPDELPIVAHHANRGEWYVTMRAGDWFPFYLAWLMYRRTL